MKPRLPVSAWHRPVRRATLSAVLAVLIGYGGSASAAGPRMAEGMGVEEARHLLYRTGFAATPAEVERFARLSRDEAVDRLLAGTRRSAMTPPPAWTERYERVFRPDMTAEERQQANRREQIERGLELRAWWLTEMVNTPSPLTERMTLFWHSHFATSQQKVRVAWLMWQQNVLLREHAVGNFATLLHAMAKDPAMLLYLDGAQNRRTAPNENFARELMELFTLGEGHYTERDVKEAARAFAGWSVDADHGRFLLRPFQQDRGPKVLFGRSGNFGGADVLDLLLEQPATAARITSKLWREFVGEPLEEDRETMARLAEAFRSGGYEIKPLLRGILLSERFWSAGQRGNQIKSPVDLVVGTLRGFERPAENPAALAIVLRGLGQDLFGPPNVKGWPGGDAWLSASSLLARKAFLDRLFRTDAQADESPAASAMMATRDPAARAYERAQRRRMAPQSSGAFSASAWLAAQDSESGRTRERLVALLLALPPVELTVAELRGEPLAFLRALVLDPAYQLK